MTTKPKPRKAPAAKSTASDPTLKETLGAKQRKISKIKELVSRWDLLEADQIYQANIVPTEK